MSSTSGHLKTGAGLEFNCRPSFPRWLRRFGCARIRPSQSGIRTSWHTRSTWNQSWRSSKRMTSRETPTQSHSIILYHGFDLQAPATISRVYVAGNVITRTETISYASNRTRLLFTSYCISISVWQCHTRPNPPFPPQAALWLADSPETSLYFGCIPFGYLHKLNFLECSVLSPNHKSFYIWKLTFFFSCVKEQFFNSLFNNVMQ